MEQPGPCVKSYERISCNFVPGALSGASAVDDQTNVVQLVLMTIVEIVHSGQQKRLAAGGSGALSERDCHQITEDAIDRVMALLESRVPVGCGLSQETVRLFIESLFQTAEGTFFNLLENPHIMEVRKLDEIRCQPKRSRGLTCNNFLLRINRWSGVA